MRLPLSIAGAALLAITAVPVHAAVFGGTFTVTANSTDPGLVINTPPLGDGLFSTSIAEGRIRPRSQSR